MNPVLKMINGDLPWDHRSKKPRVVLGGICWDIPLLVARLTVGRKHRIESLRRFVGGGAANVAIGHRHLLAPETPVVLLAQRGNDRDGHELHGLMAAQSIEMPLPPAGRETTSASFVISEQDSGAGTILTLPGARALPIPLDVVEQALSEAEACCLVALAVNDQFPEILEIAASHLVPVFLGLGSAQVYQLGYQGLEEALVEDVEMVICNRDEARTLTGKQATEDQLRALQFDGRVRTAVITDGSAGIQALRDGRRSHVPAYHDGRPVADDVGAGDAAQAAIVDALLRGYPLEAALRAGARQGFEACTALGATSQLLDGVEMQDYLAGSGAGAPGLPEKVMLKP